MWRVVIREVWEGVGRHGQEGGGGEGFVRSGAGGRLGLVCFDRVDL